jgi:hypothetical protein
VGWISVGPGSTGEYGLPTHLREGTLVLPEYCGRLYLVFGFDGIFLVDADSPTEAQDLYCDYHQCHVTMTEHVMPAPNPEQWGVLWECPPVPEHLCVDEGTDNDSCRVCDPPLPYMTMAEVDPQDPRMSSIDLEADKAAAREAADELGARSGAEHPETD